MPISILLLQSNYNKTKYHEWCISSFIYSAFWCILYVMNFTSTQMFKIPWIQGSIMHPLIRHLIFWACNLWPNQYFNISSNLQPCDMGSTYKGNTITIGSRMWQHYEMGLPYYSKSLNLPLNLLLLSGWTFFTSTTRLEEWPGVLCWWQQYSHHFL